ncbi:hypothetical protein [Peribacillus frigoritolerans]
MKETLGSAWLVSSQVIIQFQKHLAYEFDFILDGLQRFGEVVLFFIIYIESMPLITEVDCFLLLESHHRTNTILYETMILFHLCC